MTLRWILSHLSSGEMKAAFSCFQNNKNSQREWENMNGDEASDYDSTAANKDQLEMKEINRSENISWQNSPPTFVWLSWISFLLLCEFWTSSLVMSLKAFTTSFIIIFSNYLRQRASWRRKSLELRHANYTDELFNESDANLAHHI